MESELYKSIFEKGEARGEARGETKTYAELLVQHLVHRLGTVEPVVQERIRAMSDVAILRDWYNTAVFSSDTDAVRRLADTIRKTATS